MQKCSLNLFKKTNVPIFKIGGQNEHEYHQPYSLMNFRRDSFILAHGANESTFSHDGRIPSSMEAERFFNGGHVLDNSGASSFNDSRLSFGFGRHGQRVPLTPGKQDQML